MGLDLLIIIVPILIGYIIGTLLERNHFASIRAREAKLQGRVFTYNKDTVPPGVDVSQTRLIAGSVVVSVDAFKRLAAKLHSFFGGRLTAYESLMDRARREAILRMREKADAIGATMILGVRLETSAINDGDPKRTTGLEMIAYGTAILPSNPDIRA
jgi:uncharacterized protein YbjQ (UPF0145 family)